jgi:ATP-dependent RNA helicase MSS116, mitochondrial
MIPAVEKILEQRNNINNRNNSNAMDISCLIISPTRELTFQICAEAQKLVQFQRNMRVVACVGGTNINADKKALQHSVQFLVATPGRLLDHMTNTETNGVKLVNRFKALQVLILDEADQLLDLGFRPDIQRILNLLAPSRSTRQTLLFSATVPDSVAEIADLALRSPHKYVDTVGEDQEQTHLHVKQELYVTPQGAEQIRAIWQLLLGEISQANAAKEPYKIIVFFTTARLTGFLAELFNSMPEQKRGFGEVLEIHSRKSQSVRQKASDKFRKATTAVLFSSDVSARGMDYPDVTFVLQVGLTNRAQYIHRLGRTARQGKQGKGGLLLAVEEERFMTQTELPDMPLVKVPVVLLSINANDACPLMQALNGGVARDKELKESAEQAYRAWLGYYNGHLKKVGWDKKQLVVAANLWVKDMGIGQPKIQRKTVGKMGLKGVPGLLLE